MESGFEVIGEVASVEIIAIGGAVRDVRRLIKSYGNGRWRKLKGVATVRLRNGRICRAEIHWYEAHGLGKKDLKIKRYIE